MVVGKAYDFVFWLLPKVEKFDRSFRFSVGDRLVSSGLDLLLLLVEAAYSKDKSALLRDANLKANALRYLLRLSKDLKLLSIDSYGFATEQLECPGYQGSRMQSLGDWFNALLEEDALELVVDDSSSCANERDNHLCSGVGYGDHSRLRAEARITSMCFIENGS